MNELDPVVTDLNPDFALELDPVKTGTLVIGVREGDDVDLRATQAPSGPFAANAMALNGFARGTTDDVSLDKLVEAKAVKTRNFAKQLAADDQPECFRSVPRRGRELLSC